jgi:hypothetical protein
MTDTTNAARGEVISAPESALPVFGLTLGKHDTARLGKEAKGLLRPLDKNGNWVREDGAFARDGYTVRPLPDASLDALFTAVRQLAPNPHVSFLLGVPRAGLDLNAKHRVTRDKFEDQPQRVLVLDIDKVRVPDGLGAPDKLPELAAHVVGLLGREFEGVRAVASASASTGRLGLGVGALRLFFLWEKPWSIAQMKAWANAKNDEWKAAGSSLRIDPSIYTPGKWIFTARPSFPRGVSDPVPQSQWAFLTAGVRDTLDLTPPANVAPLPRHRSSRSDGGAGTAEVVPMDILGPLFMSIDIDAPAFEDRPTWIGLCHALQNASGNAPEARDMWLEQCSKWKNGSDPDKDARAYDTLGKDSRNGVGLLTLYARETGGEAGWNAYMAYVRWLFGLHPLLEEDLARIAAREIEPGFVRERALLGINTDYAFLHQHPKHVFWLTRPKPSDPALIPIEGFRNVYENKPVPVVKKDGRNGAEKTDMVNPAALWMKWPGRAEYREIDYYPLGKEPDGCLNLFRGLAVEPKQGTCPLVHDYLLNVLCDGDKAVYDWLRNLLFWKIQNPTENPQSGLFLTGTKGSGKSTFGDFLGRIFGPHFVLFDRKDENTTVFNNLEDGCFVGLFEECMFGGDKKAGETLKAQITSPTFILNGKNQPARQVRNGMLRVYVSNKISGIPIEPDDRRFLVLRVSDAYDHSKGDANKAYFNAFYAALDEEIPAFVYEALNTDVSAWDKIERRHIPRTKARAEAAAAVATPEEDFVSWLFTQGREALPMLSLELSVQPDSKSPQDADDPWSSVAIAVRMEGLHGLYLDYRNRHFPRAHPRTSAELLAELKRLTGNRVTSEQRRDKRQGSERARFWVFPALEDCRAAHDAVTGGTGGWNGDEIV